MQIRNTGTEDVPVESIKPHPENPNRGRVGLIEESIEENGWYGFVYCQLRHDDGSESRTIVAGEHSWLAAQAGGAETVPVCWLDIDDATARRILAVDNAATRQSRDEPDLLAALLQKILDEDESLSGTGYIDDDLSRLLDEVSAAPAAGGGSSLLDPPNEFREVDETIEPDHTCPKCGYEWRGKAT